MASSSLQVDVYIAPIVPFTNPSPTSSPLTSQWSPISCTLIHGPTSAILIDTPITIAQTLSLITWIKHKIPNKTLTHTFTTHAHPDHFLGLPTLAEHFPGLKHLATSSVVAGVQEAYEPANFAIWESFFPGENVLHSGRIIPDALPESNEFALDGFAMKAYDVPHSDCSHSSFLHAPSLSLVVAGDIVYGDCHQMLAECNTSSKREGWLRALGMVEDLKPMDVVPGHARVWKAGGEEDGGDGGLLIQQTRAYIEGFEKELEVAGSVEELMERMRKSWPERWNEFVLEVSCAASWAGRSL